MGSERPHSKRMTIVVIESCDRLSFFKPRENLATLSRFVNDSKGKTVLDFATLVQSDVVSRKKKGLGYREKRENFNLWL